MDIKRAFDFSFSAILLFFCAPVLMLLAIMVRLKLGSPIFFRQPRPGLNSKPFMLIKFRTMTDAKNSSGKLLPDGSRLNSFGKFLRSSSLDELPELFNVIKGEMSLVGPRPLLIEYLPLYSTHQARRHEVRPGITGWAQINGRNSLSWEEKFAMDVWYVGNQNFWLDMKILWLTVQKVIAREGISAQGEVTMPKFTGDNSRKGS
jgi:lipopolysaccharide/colanic/teichoic acid biosynthesis glycosyltransferase